MRVPFNQSIIPFSSFIYFFFLVVVSGAAVDREKLLEQSCAEFDIPGSPLAVDGARRRWEAFAHGSSWRQQRGEVADTDHEHKGTAWTEFDIDEPNSSDTESPIQHDRVLTDCKLDLKTRSPFRPCRFGCWWNEDTSKCNCCPQGSHRCGGGKHCCPVGTYCMKSATGEEGCCPDGHQCAAEPEPEPEGGVKDKFHGNELRMVVEVPPSPTSKPRCSNPSFRLCPSETFCCPPEWVCYKDGMGTARCGRD